MNKNKAKEQKKLIVTILEVNYTETLGKEVSDEFLKNNNIFPRNWFLIEDSNIKIKILSEAIQKKCKIVETKRYFDLIESVKQ